MAKSLQQFEEWARKERSVANPGGSYRGECVSLVQQYLNQVFGIPYAPRGHAAWFVPPGFKALPGNTKPRPGDIIRYGTNYGWGYGHIGMIDDEGEYFDQNGVHPRRVGERSKPFGDVRVVYRPTKEFNVKTPKSKKKSDTTIAKEVIAGKWGNGPSRVIRLKKAGYNPSTIQKIVNKLLK